MSTQQAQKSKWGSLFSGAVAGLESRLDNILTDEGSAATKNAEFERRREEAKKLKALALESQRASPAGNESQVREETPSVAAKSGASGLTTVQSEIASQPETSHDAKTTGADSEPGAETKHAEDGLKNTSIVVESVARLSEASSRPSLEGLASGTETTTASSAPTVSTAVDEAGTTSEFTHAATNQFKEPETSFEEAESVEADELQEHLERIDALQAKLQYLAKDAASVAKQAAANAADGSIEKKLAAKDEQIALLLEEGTKLSKAEVTQAATIRRLRLKINEDSKTQSEARRLMTKAEAATLALQDRIARLEAEKKDAVSKLSRLARLEKELGDARRERGTKDATIHDLQSQLSAAKKQADENARVVAERALEQEKKVAQSLRDDLSNAKIEQTLRDDRAKTQLKEAQDETRRQHERHQVSELSLRNELSTLETRLELMRERSEEASSGTSNDSQAKMMRQVETLQSQYAVASENWQTLESSMQSRLTALEREKDEASRAESEARKRAREHGSNARRLQDQLDDVNQRCQVFEQEILEHKARADRHLAQAHDAEKNLKDELDRFQAERNDWDSKLQTRLEEERSKWQLASPRTPNEAPSLLTLGSPRDYNQRRTSYMDVSGLVSRRQASRQMSELSLSGYERPSSRKTSTFVSRNKAASPNGLDSERSTPGLDNGQMPDAPSIHTVDVDEREHDSSPHRTVNDMLSNTTASAGPTVQLVERMSAAVRRLETEKAASKDELARLSGQRDESRKEVVNLMREVEQTRAFKTKVENLEQSLAEVNQRYATTLEMLGERSERVEELEADVTDLKKIYRELVESTMK